MSHDIDAMEQIKTGMKLVAFFLQQRKKAVAQDFGTGRDSDDKTLIVPDNLFQTLIKDRIHAGIRIVADQAQSVKITDTTDQTIMKVEHRQGRRRNAIGMKRAPDIFQIFVIRGKTVAVGHGIRGPSLILTQRKDADLHAGIQQFTDRILCPALIKICFICQQKHAISSPILLQ